MYEQIMNWILFETFEKGQDMHDYTNENNTLMNLRY